MSGPTPPTISVPARTDKVYAGTITRSHVHAGTYGAVQSLMAAGLIHRWQIRTHGPYLANARNQLVRNFFSFDNPTDEEIAAAETNPGSVGPYDILLFIDSDMRPTNETARPVIESVTPETPIVGGLYLNPAEGNVARPVIYEIEEQGFMQPPPGPIPGSGLMTVGGIGTGFLAIHRTVLERFRDTFDEPVPWFTDLVFGDPPQYIGEDLAFCVRAHSLGIPVCVHRDAKIGHYKEVLLECP